uniref:YjbH domain-containing protein n=1 Tax=Algoriphagus sp. TaxID=1872435 RepID=UPI004048A8C4
MLPLLSVSLSASDFGTTGLIDIPTARMAMDGTLTATAATQSMTNAYAVTYQITPWLEGTFRYTGWNDFFYYDRNYEAKALLFKESDYFPQVAIGIRDVVGTGVYGAEYLVASKTFGDLDVTLGMGWGRLAGKGHFKNPLTQLSDSYSQRNNDSGLGGEVSTNLFFRGEQVGLFGGAQYTLSDLPLSILVEYNPDQYDWERRGGVSRPKSPVSAALVWNALPGVTLSLSRQHNQEWGLSISAALDTKARIPTKAPPAFVSSVDIPATQLPTQLNKDSWYDMLLYDVERSGLILVAGSVDDESRKATLVIGNKSYPHWPDAVDRLRVLADLHLPRNVKHVKLIVEEEGHRVHTLSVARGVDPETAPRSYEQQEIAITQAVTFDNPQHRTSFAQKKVFADINLAARVQLFDPDDPARYQLYTKIGLSYMVTDTVSLRGSYAVDIDNTFDTSTRSSDSVLPHVRSDVVKYLKEGDSGLDSLYAEKRGSLSGEMHYRVYGGILEEMYSGAGGELLYLPHGSRLGFSVSGNWVKQRDYDRSFKHLDYDATTAFLSAFWASPFYDLDVAVHAGKYLAGDVGATFEVRRTFSNGWMVGLWATLTDVPFDDFGEGSFDKGMFFRIPFASLAGANTRGSYATRVRPIQRDGGARLEDFSGNIWWDLRNARYDVFAQPTSARGGP